MVPLPHIERLFSHIYYIGIRHRHLYANHYPSMHGASRGSSSESAQSQSGTHPDGRVTSRTGVRRHDTKILSGGYVLPRAP